MWLVNPCLLLQPHLKQVHNLLTTWPLFSFSEKTLSPFLPQSLCTCSSCCLESSSFITHLIDSFSSFKLSVQIVTSSESSFLTLFKVCPLLHFLILTEIFQVYILICNYIFEDEDRNHVSFVYHHIPSLTQYLAYRKGAINICWISQCVNEWFSNWLNEEVVKKKQTHLCPSAWVARKMTVSFTYAERSRGKSDIVQCQVMI